MAKTIIRPSADAVCNGWEGNCASGCEAWERVNEIVADDGALLVIEAAETETPCGGATFRCSLNNPIIDPTSTINSVEYFWRGAIAGIAGATATLFAHDGVSTQDNQITGENFGGAFAWTTVSQVDTTAPDGGGWTLAKLEALQMGATAGGQGGGRAIAVTQMYAEVDYDPVNVADPGQQVGPW